MSSPIINLSTLPAPSRRNTEGVTQSFEALLEKYGIDTNDYLNLEKNAQALVKYFQDRKVVEACLARDFKKVRFLVNGGLNGFDEFISVIRQFLA